MYHTFTGSSRRPRHVDLSGRTRRPGSITLSSSTGTPSPGGFANGLTKHHHHTPTHQALLASAQHERAIRHQSRQCAVATPCIQRYWRGFAARRCLYAELRASFDAEFVKSTDQIDTLTAARRLVIFFKASLPSDLDRLTTLLCLLFNPTHCCQFNQTDSTSPYRASEAHFVQLGIALRLLFLRCLRSIFTLTNGPSGTFLPAHIILLDCLRLIFAHVPQFVARYARVYYFILARVATRFSPYFPRQSLSTFPLHPLIGMRSTNETDIGFSCLAACIAPLEQIFSHTLDIYEGFALEILPLLRVCTTVDDEKEDPSDLTQLIRTVQRESREETVKTSYTAGYDGAFVSLSWINELASAVNYKLLGSVLSGLLRNKSGLVSLASERRHKEFISVFGRDISTPKDAILGTAAQRMNLLAVYIYFHRFIHEKRNVQAYGNSCNYLTVVGSLLLSVLKHRVLREFQLTTLSDEVNNDRRGRGKGNSKGEAVILRTGIYAFFREQITSLVETDAVSVLFSSLTNCGASDAHRENLDFFSTEGDVTDKPDGSFIWQIPGIKYSDLRITYALILLEAFPKLADEIRMWLYLGSTSFGSRSWMVDKRPPLIKWLWSVVRQTRFVKDIVRDVQASASAMRRCGDVEWRFVLMLFELYTFVLKIIDDEEFLAGSLAKVSGPGSIGENEDKIEWTSPSELRGGLPKDLAAAERALDAREATGGTVTPWARNVALPARDLRMLAAFLRNFGFALLDQAPRLRAAMRELRLQQNKSNVEGRVLDVSTFEAGMVAACSSKNGTPLSLHDQTASGGFTKLTRLRNFEESRNNDISANGGHRSTRNVPIALCGPAPQIRPSFSRVKVLTVGVLRMVHDRDARREFLDSGYWRMAGRKGDDGDEYAEGFVAAVVAEDARRSNGGAWGFSQRGEAKPGESMGGSGGDGGESGNTTDSDDDREDEIEEDEEDDNFGGDDGDSDEVNCDDAPRRRPPGQRRAARRREMLLNAPFFVAFETRVRLFRHFIHLDKLRRDPHYFDSDDTPSINVPTKHYAHIRRGHEFIDAFRQFYSLGEGIKDPLSISFVDQFGTVEAGIDGGGVTKEFLLSVTHQALRADPDAEPRLVVATPAHLLYLNPWLVEERKCQLERAGISRDSPEFSGYVRGVLEQFEFLGCVLGKCLYEGILVDVEFAGFFLLQWASTGVGLHAAPRETTYRATLNDLRELDGPLYEGLLKLKNYRGNVEDLALNFTITDSFIVDHETGARETIDRELKTGGARIPVNNSNRLEYISLVARHRLQLQGAAQLNAFLRGFGKIIPASWLSLFSRGELQMLVGGTTRLIDVEDLRRNTIYGGAYAFGSQEMEHFIEIDYFSEEDDGDDDDGDDEDEEMEEADAINEDQHDESGSSSSSSDEEGDDEDDEDDDEDEDGEGDERSVGGENDTESQQPGEHPTVQLFWRVMHGFNDAERRAVLKFVTSSPRAPLLGFASLHPKFCIRDSGNDESRLPSTSTCVNLLKLPRYSTEETLREKLLYAVFSGAGFDLS